MTRQAAAALRLAASRERLRGVLADDAAIGTLGALALGLVRRHPLASAAVSMLLGGLLVRARPWRWALKPELWSALLPALMATLANAPMSTWSGLLASFVRQAHAGRGARAALKALRCRCAGRRRRSPVAAAWRGTSPRRHA